MRVPISWLKDYVDIELPIEELAHRLTLAGLEVAAIEYIGLPAGEGQATTANRDHLVWDRDKIVVGHIVEVRPHPNADRLVLAMIDHGVGQIETVVTGATNLFPYLGQGPLDPPLVTAYAREGAEVIDGHKDDGSRLIIKERALRGIPNRSMACSEKELGLSDEHEGILIFESDAPPGTPLQDVLGDVVLDLDLTPNLARCYSILGVAREVAALTGQAVRLPPTEVVMQGKPIEGQVGIDIRQPELNPRFTLGLVHGVKIGPSPEWMQRRLKLAGMRPINNMVDVTNYVMLEVGQPLHAFDYEILVERAGGKPTIITRLAEDGERMQTLDGVMRNLDPFTIMVCDERGPLGIGGIMGGAESEVSQTTTSVLLEAAAWNFINIRQTLQAQRERGQAIPSEAGARFSRGVHPAQAMFGQLRAIELMRSLGGGTVAQGIVDEYPLLPQPVVVDLPRSEVTRILGVELEVDEIAGILEGLDFGVERLEGETLRVTAPDHRMDIGLPPGSPHQAIAETVAQADLIEEIARIYGYDRIPTTEMADTLPPQRGNPALEREEQVRDLLVRAGLQEVIAYRLTTPEREALLVPPGLPSNLPDVGYVRLANPISQDKVVMRHTLLAGLLDALAANTRWRERQLLFEIGKVYLPVEGEKLPDEPRRLCIALSGGRGILSWTGYDPTPMDYFDLKGVVEGLLDGLHLPDARFEATAHGTFHLGRTAALIVGGEAVGVLGELHPLVAEAFGLEGRVVLAAEFDLEALLGAIPPVYEVEPVSRYEAIYQDVALVVDEDVPAAAVEEAIRQVGGDLLRDVRLFDVYRGEQVGADKKSLAYALTFQAPDRTLTDKDAAKVQAKIVRRLGEKLGATLRQ
jgi:phenylalanyl-tRNA synthetase beta chain